MSSGPVVAVVAEGHQVIAGFRSLAGATDPTKAAPGSIRGDLGRDWGLAVQQNLVHGSDSPESAGREIALWFPAVGDRPARRLTPGSAARRRARPDESSHSSHPSQPTGARRTARRPRIAAHTAFTIRPPDLHVRPLPRAAFCEPARRPAWR